MLIIISNNSKYTAPLFPAVVNKLGSRAMVIQTDISYQPSFQVGASVDPRQLLLESDSLASNVLEQELVVGVRDSLTMNKIVLNLFF
jgi:hypothetical protein